MSRTIETLTKEEQKQLLNQFNLRYITPHRNKVMIELFLKTGLRVSEMINLRYKDINYTTGRIDIIDGKGGKNRKVFISLKMINMISEWQERQYREWGKTDIVFSTRTLNKLDTKAIWKMIKTYKNKAGIEKDITTHDLRHTFASEVLRETKDIRLVQELLGHSDIRTTQIYTHLNTEDIKKGISAIW